MPYFIGKPCIDELDRSCMQECPVDCIYEGARKLYINPNECIECGACEAACPVDAIASDLLAVADGAETWRQDNARFFDEPLPHRDAPIGQPGGAAIVGVVGMDTDLVASVPLRA